MSTTIEMFIKKNSFVSLICPLSLIAKQGLGKTQPVERNH